MSSLNIILCIILSSLRLVNVIHDDPDSPDFIFTIMLVVNSGMYKHDVTLEEFGNYVCRIILAVKVTHYEI